MADSTWNPDWNRPTRLILHGDKKLAAEHRGEANRALFQLRNAQNAGWKQDTLRKVCSDGSEIKVHSKVEGMDIVEITAGRGGEWVLVSEERMTSLVAIIDLTTDGTTVDGRACFDVSEGGWGSLCAWTNDVQHNTLDPVAPYTGQDTWRTWWYDKTDFLEYGSPNEKTTIDVHIVQLQRVDGGYWAYDGSPSDYEDGDLFATMINYDSWYPDPDEDAIKAHILSTLEVDPGPCPIPPYDDWTWFASDGGTYYGEEGLFVTAWTGSAPPGAGCCRYWWPEEFSQRITYDQPGVSGQLLYVDTNEFSDGDNLPLSHIFYQAAINITYHNNYRKWINLPTADHTESSYDLVHSTEDWVSDTFPYTSMTMVPYESHTAEPNLIEGFECGVYVYHVLDHFIAPVFLYHDYQDLTRMEQVEERFPVDEGRICATEFGLLTANQLELLQGNSHVTYDPPFPTSLGTFDTVYRSRNREHETPYFDVGVYCEGVFYKVRDSKAFSESSTTGSNHLDYWGYEWNGECADVGIFTQGAYNEPGEEIKSEQLVYVHAMYDEEVVDGRWTPLDVQYGVLFGGDTGARTHAVSPVFDVNQEIYRYSPCGIIPDFEGVGQNEKQLYMMPQIVVGKKETIIRKYARVTNG